jgi:hypothetical protein
MKKHRIAVCIAGLFVGLASAFSTVAPAYAAPDSPWDGPGHQHGSYVASDISPRAAVDSPDADSAWD